MRSDGYKMRTARDRVEQLGSGWTYLGQGGMDKIGRDGIGWGQSCRVEWDRMQPEQNGVSSFELGGLDWAEPR